MYSERCGVWGEWSWLALRDKHVYDLWHLKQFPANGLRYLAALTVPERLEDGDITFYYVHWRWFEVTSSPVHGCR